jgi:hypothetical protein
MSQDALVDGARVEASPVTVHRPFLGYPPGAVSTGPTARGTGAAVKPPSSVTAATPFLSIQSVEKTYTTVRAVAGISLDAPRERSMRSSRRQRGGCRRLAGRLFGAAMLMYGKEPSLREMVRWMRQG